MDDRIYNYTKDDETALMDERETTYIVPYKPEPRACLEGIPTGIELDESWRPITASDSYRMRQVGYGFAACLLLSFFFVGLCLFYTHFTKLGYYQSLRFWVIGLAIPPFCIWAIFKQGIYSVQYASIRGILGTLSVLAVAGFAFVLCDLWLPAVHGLGWKILLAVPCYILLPALFADVILNIPNRSCIEWRKRG